MVSITDSPIRIQTSSQSVLSTPSWFGEPALIARAQAGWFLTDQRQYLFTLAHQDVSSDILISLRNPWDLDVGEIGPEWSTLSPRMAEVIKFQVTG